MPNGALHVALGRQNGCQIQADPAELRPQLECPLVFARRFGQLPSSGEKLASQGMGFGHVRIRLHGGFHDLPRFIQTVQLA